VILDVWWRHWSWRAGGRESSARRTAVLGRRADGAQPAGRAPWYGVVRRAIKPPPSARYLYVNGSAPPCFADKLRPRDVRTVLNVCGPVGSDRDEAAARTVRHAESPALPLSVCGRNWPRTDHEITDGYLSPVGGQDPHRYAALLPYGPLHDRWRSIRRRRSLQRRLTDRPPLDGGSGGGGASTLNVVETDCSGRYPDTRETAAEIPFTWNGLQLPETQ